MTTTQWTDITYAKKKFTHNHPTTSAHHRPGAAGAATDFFNGSGASAHRRKSDCVAHGVPLPPASGTQRRPERVGSAGAVDWEGDAVAHIAGALRGLFCYSFSSCLRRGGGRWGLFCSGLLCKAQQFVHAVGFCLQCAQRYALKLELPGVWWVLAPLANGTSGKPQRSRQGTVAAVVGDGFRCFHVR